MCSWFLLQEPNVSLIITDYWMPEMTGYELLKKVKVICSTSKKPFLFCLTAPKHFGVIAKAF
jgi:response regulator RpfG family c-di-GMP phosphodiesterase